MGNSVNNFFASVWTDITGFFGNLGHALGWAFGIVFTGLADIIRAEIQAMIQWIADKIHDITVAIEELKFHLSQELSSFYNTTFGFWSILIAAAVSVVALPAIVTAAMAEASKTGLIAFINSTAASVESWQGWQVVNAVVEANRIAQVLFSSYDAIWQGIYSDVSSISLDIGYSVSTISNLIASTRALLVTTYTIMGADTNTAELTALANMSTYLQGLSDNFDRYAQNPQLIWDDLWNNVILPRQKSVREYFKKEAEAILFIQQEMLQIEKLPGEFTSFQANVQKTLGIQLDSNMQSTEQAVLQQVQKLFTEYNSQIGSKIDAINKSIGPLIAASEKHDAEINANTKLLDKLNASLNDTLGGSSAITLAAVFGNEFATELAYLSSDNGDTGISFITTALFTAAKIDAGILPQSAYDLIAPNLLEFTSPVKRIFV